MVVVGRPGSGKTTLLNRLVEWISRSTESEILVADAAREIALPDGDRFAKIEAPLSPDGAREIARAALELRPFGWLVADDAENYLDPHGYRQNPLWRLINMRRNDLLKINILLAIKDPLEVPRQIRRMPTVWLVSPAEEAETQRWHRKSGHPADILPDEWFWLRRGPLEDWKKIHVKKVDIASIVG